jgi:hypothetical protein
VPGTCRCDSCPGIGARTILRRLRPSPRIEAKGREAGQRAVPQQIDRSGRQTARPAGLGRAVGGQPRLPAAIQHGSLNTDPAQHPAGPRAGRRECVLPRAVRVRCADGCHRRGLAAAGSRPRRAPRAAAADAQPATTPAPAVRAARERMGSVQRARGHSGGPAGRREPAASRGPAGPRAGRPRTRSPACVVRR